MLNKLNAVLASFAMFAFGTVSHAAIIAADVAPIQTDISTTITNITPAVLAILALVMGVKIGVKLVKSLIGAGS